MLFPVRCVSCGKPIGHLWEQFKAETKDRSVNVKETLDKLSVQRFCCRQQFMGHVELAEEAAQFKKA